MVVDILLETAASYVGAPAVDEASHQNLLSPGKRHASLDFREPMHLLPPRKTRLKQRSQTLCSAMLKRGGEPPPRHDTPGASESTEALLQQLHKPFGTTLSPTFAEARPRPPSVHAKLEGSLARTLSKGTEDQDIQRVKKVSGRQSETPYRPPCLTPINVF